MLVVDLYWFEEPTSDNKEEEFSFSSSPGTEGIPEGEGGMEIKGSSQGGDNSSSFQNIPRHCLSFSIPMTKHRLFGLLTPTLTVNPQLNNEILRNVSTSELNSKFQVSQFSKAEPLSSEEVK